jgi:DNA-binding PadR family transcriptional regulator
VTGARFEIHPNDLVAFLLLEPGDVSAKTIKEGFDRHPHPNPGNYGTIYRMLARLERQGFVASVAVPSKRSRRAPRRFGLTAPGRSRLHEMLETYRAAHDHLMQSHHFSDLGDAQAGVNRPRSDTGSTASRTSQIPVRHDVGRPRFENQTDHPMNKTSSLTALASGEQFRLTVNANDRGHLHLELTDDEGDRVSVRIPADVWHTLQRVGPHDFNLAEASDEELRTISETMVRGRQDILESFEGSGWTVRLTAGFAGIGGTDAPVEVQVQSGIESLERRRTRERHVLDRAAQHEILRTYASLEGGLWDDAETTAKIDSDR